DLITVIITTSPTPSSPSTELISTVLESFRRHCPDLAKTHVIVVFDNYDRIAAKERLKAGSVTQEIADNYSSYKENVKSLILNEYIKNDDRSALKSLEGKAEFGSEGKESNAVDLAITQTETKNVTFIEPVARLGFGLAVRSALRIVDTPYVWVQQHDWTLVADLPLQPMLEVMRESESDEERSIKYVSFTSIRMLQYAQSEHVIAFPALRSCTASAQKEFTPQSQPDVKIPLTPLFFWFDKPHIASTAHYLASVFPSRLSMRRGDFIEDKIGQQARDQMKEGLWHKWACWLYYPEDGKKLFLRHLKGRTWKGGDGELAHK
ncbi:hypothetical protein ASPWEDRAFT_98847, partial [Aspergillus wentii DTO 134E9]